MSVIAHPSKSSVERFAVRNKQLGTVKYFSISKYGSIEEALAAAEALDKKLNNDAVSPFRKRTQLDRIFAQDGSVLGLKRTALEKFGVQRDVFIAQLYQYKRQYSFNIEINKEVPFDKAYRKTQNQILKRLKIRRTPEITEKFNACMGLYLVNEDAKKLEETRKLENLLFSAKW